MKIQLVSYSQPTQEFADQGVADAQELIAYCACATAITAIFPMAAGLVAPD